MRFDSIHHVALIGSDYERSRHFYVDLLGFEVIREHHRLDRNDWKIDLRCGEQEIELFIKDGCPPRASYPEALGLRHLAFRVDSVERTAAELNRLGIDTEPIRMDEFTNKPMTFFHDPDGQPLEIHE
ncbi:VOC family protein [Bifidobacterium amazonense]|uniref:VOC family protein n=1 Tax=Bifidobacterium amazonense TaxID=2809027 RepID=A0ABS9VX62_9BIFI|nr:VOC family protein [Bifidobacterium amazonense]MCH9276708.1 VOC family protein [Bifidobacterium amazonense]